MAEIAEELRVNPATVRLWVSKGTLPAMRAGQRKLLIRRSDLNHMLGQVGQTITLQLPRELIERLDARAHERGESRAATIRRLLVTARP
ncbi:MAG: helix-turn-helix domain-containing protein [Solirubrobacteraceae bacterium]